MIIQQNLLQKKSIPPVIGGIFGVFQNQFLSFIIIYIVL